MQNSFSYFNITEATGKIASLQAFKYPKAVPTTGGIIDVYNELPWKLSKQNDEIPSIILEEYELTYGRLTASLLKLAQNVTNAVGTGTVDPYVILYNGKPTGFRYNLPYIVPGQIRGGISHNYSVDSGLLSEGNDSYIQSKFPNFAKVLGIGETAAEIVTGMAEAGVQFGMEEIIKYNKTNARVITVSFILYNTVDVESANKNYSFVNLLQFQNLKTRTSFMTQRPPCIYTVSTSALGGVFMPAAYLSVDVKARGVLRKMSDLGTGSPRLLPEAYEVAISITEMVPQSSNIMAGELGNKKVQVIGDIKGAIEKLEGEIKNKTPETPELKVTPPIIKNDPPTPPPVVPATPPAPTPAKPPPTPPASGPNFPGFNGTIGRDLLRGD